MLAWYGKSPELIAWGFFVSTTGKSIGRRRRSPLLVEGSNPYPVLFPVVVNAQADALTRVGSGGYTG